jgi:hypothetical protein
VAIAAESVARLGELADDELGYFRELFGSNAESVDVVGILIGEAIAAVDAVADPVQLGDQQYGRTGHSDRRLAVVRRVEHPDRHRRVVDDRCL